MTDVDQGWTIGDGPDPEFLYADPGFLDELLNGCTHGRNVSCGWACPTWGRERRRERRYFDRFDRLRRKKARHRNDRFWLARNTPWWLADDEFWWTP